ncbi:MAG: [Fe-Fe] hydrogenase large subunit C-terminal domain-containing protein [Bacteroidales bacterium]|jgi:iron only hydrogenase large subunit-like protein|nr:[Fe-Fe] hydrogenase large subunit C-terminal domain-containing protein [Bacteroidales bacterium]
MENKSFHHALKIQKDQCIGCSHCMNICPTEAIRVRNGKAELFENRCIDCGECFRVCPVGAIIIEQDDFNKIFQYKYRIALLPAVFSGQFPEEVKTTQIYDVLIDLGFTDVYEVEHGVDLLKDSMREYARVHEEGKPLISSFCPAVIRLIQVKFPALVENIIPLHPPLDIAALYYKKMLIDKGVDESDIGIFYVTPCAAKIAAVKSPVGNEKSPINGVINMDFIFNKVYTNIRRGNFQPGQNIDKEQLSPEGVLWSLTNGEIDNMDGRCLAIDGVHNVIDFLEKIENEEIKDVDFLELRACDESCAGGVLTTKNRFLTVERLKQRASHYKKSQHETLPKQIIKYHPFLKQNIGIGKVRPRSMMKLDENMAEAMKKMRRVKEIMKCLPGVDCGACGAPTCQALAEDIVQERAVINHCVFIQKIFEKKGILEWEQSHDIMQEIWGKDKLNRKC